MFNGICTFFLQPITTCNGQSTLQHSLKQKRLLLEETVAYRLQSVLKVGCFLKEIALLLQNKCVELLTYLIYPLLHIQPSSFSFPA